MLSDHGEEFCEHGGWTHGHSLHREVISVPLVIRAPDTVAPATSRGRRIRGIATLLDVAPTLTELCGIEDPRIGDPQRSGRSLLPQVIGKGPQAETIGQRPVLAEVTMSPVSLRSIRDGGLLAIRAKAPMQEAVSAFDDARDPGHRTDVRVDRKAEVDRVLDTMDDLFARLAAVALFGGSRDIDAGTLEALRKLGYLGGR
jgi:arylsulfatase A-like enzyme